MDKNLNIDAHMKSMCGRENQKLSLLLESKHLTNDEKVVNNLNSATEFHLADCHKNLHKISVYCFYEDILFFL